MIDVKKAVEVAIEYIEDLYSSEDVADIALEEVELSEDERYWLITIGITRTYSKPLEKVTVSPVFIPLSKTYTTNRDYKTIKIDANTGEAKSLKIRNL
jgi:hypothetical protein